MLIPPTIEFEERVLKTSSQTVLFSLARHFELLCGKPLYTPYQTPVPRSPFPVPRSRFPVPAFSNIPQLGTVEPWALGSLSPTPTTFWEDIIHISKFSGGGWPQCHPLQSRAPGVRFQAPSVKNRLRRHCHTRWMFHTLQ